MLFVTSDQYFVDINSFAACLYLLSKVKKVICVKEVLTSFKKKIMQQKLKKSNIIVMACRTALSSNLVNYFCFVEENIVRKFYLFSTESFFQIYVL